MRFAAIPLVLVLALPALCANKRDQKAAALAYQRALKLEQQGDFAEALSSLREASSLAPADLQYLAAIAQAQQKLAYEHLQNAESALNRNDRAAALQEFSAALQFDPANPGALEGLRQAAAVRSADGQEAYAELVSESSEVHLQPKAQTATLHFAGDSQALLTQLASSFGLEATFDDNFPSRAVTLDLHDATLDQALETATIVTHTMWVARSADVIFFASNTPEKHRDFDASILRTFYLPNLSTPAQLNDISSVLRGIFDVRQVVLNGQQSLVTIRGNQRTVDAASRFLQTLNTAPPQVMLDVQVLEIDGSFARALGMNLPGQFQLINVPPSVLKLAQQGNIQQQIQNLIAQIQQNGLTSQLQQQINNLLAQLQQQKNSALASLINTPFATFGGGQTLFAITIPGISGSFGFNTSLVRNLDHATLRAANNTSASLLIGTRYPVLTSSFQVSFGSASGLATPPIFNYEDLGVSLKAKPQVNLTPAIITGDQNQAEVTLDLELSVKALGSTTFNNIPVISLKEYKGSVRLKEGEEALVLGEITRSLQHNRTGLPGFGYLPVLGDILTFNNNNNEEDELLVIITPHIVRLPDVLRSESITLPAGQ